MHKQFSIYLDLMRFSAASLVLLSHAPIFLDGFGWQLAVFGHESVMVFFVLSGYVISYVFYGCNDNVKKYTVKRLSRIYSVATPALILTFFLYNWAIHINPDAFPNIRANIDSQIISLLSGLFFFNENWVITTVLTNTPYWSLGYEVQYYILFGLFVYTSGLTRILTILTMLFIMGLNIILYLPIWLAGSLCYKLTTTTELDAKSAFWVFTGSIMGILSYTSEKLQTQLTDLTLLYIPEVIKERMLAPTHTFLADYVLTIFIVMNIYSAHFLFKNRDLFSEKIGKMIGYMSSHTFSLYLLHMPIFYFISTILPFNEYGLRVAPVYYFGVPFLTYLISIYIEKTRKHYEKFFSWLINYGH